MSELAPLTPNCSKPSVLHLCRDLPPAAGQGGLSVAVAALLSGLRAAGYRQGALSFDNWRPRSHTGHLPTLAEADFGPCWRLEGPAALAAAEAAATKWINDQTDGLILIHSDLLAHTGLAIAAATGRPAVLVAHVLQGEQRRLHGLESPTASEEAQRAALIAVDAVIAPSAFAADRLGREVHVLPPVYIAPPLKIIAPHLSAIASAGDTTAEEAVTTAANEGPLLVFVGRFDTIKGVDVLLDALPAVCAAVPAMRLTLAGGLPHNARSDLRWRQQIAEAAHRAGLPASQLSLLEFLTHDRALALLASADVVVIPSRTETFGQVTAEAMAAGRCVVATAVGALAERLRHDVTALLVPASDPPALAAALSWALADSALRQRLGDAAAHAEATRPDPCLAWQSALAAIANPPR